MDARFHSDTQLESFKHDAEEGGFEVYHRDVGTRDVTILASDNDEELRALVYLNGGDVLISKVKRTITRRDGRSKTW
ncbi:hypothetical protein LCGC14_2350860 [marine sediment metagenome]|uniref:Uncharacterized protein n=1 Tax=marine sediment metagenome TaxID=412755 RepID=A0A0F9C960_9ZZZZ